MECVRFRNFPEGQFSGKIQIVIYSLPYLVEGADWRESGKLFKYPKQERRVFVGHSYKIK